MGLDELGPWIGLEFWGLGFKNGLQALWFRVLDEFWSCGVPADGGWYLSRFVGSWILSFARGSGFGISCRLARVRVEKPRNASLQCLYLKMSKSEQPEKGLGVWGFHVFLHSDPIHPIFT